jgi:hypothetical protein
MENTWLDFETIQFPLETNILHCIHNKISYEPYCLLEFLRVLYFSLEPLTSLFTPLSLDNPEYIIIASVNLASH